MSETLTLGFPFAEFKLISAFTVPSKVENYRD